VGVIQVPTEEGVARVDEGARAAESVGRQFRHADTKATRQQQQKKKTFAEAKKNTYRRELWNEVGEEDEGEPVKERREVHKDGDPEEFGE
jgi:hypothetical protein